MTTTLTERLRDIAGALIHEAAISARPGQMDRLEEMSADLSAAARELSDHIAQTRHCYDLFAALLLVELRSRHGDQALNAVTVIGEQAVAEVMEKLQVEVDRDLVGNYVLSLVSQTVADGRAE